jgi:NTP pyrophosphatase (non-canonical NTP hydrolase)
MSIKVDGSQAKVHWLSNDHNNGRLTKEQAVLYEVDKFGQVTRDSAEGLTPAEAFEERYAGKTNLKQDLIARDIFVIDKAQGPNFDYDDGFRAFLHDLYKKDIIPFDALYPGYQLPNTDREALISYNRETHLNILLNCLKQHLGLGLFFDTKNPIVWRFKQEEDIEEIFDKLIQYRLCLYAAYTSRGKTKIGIEVAVRLCQQGGIVLVTTPITDTKKSFEENINDYHFGTSRNLKVTYMDSVAFDKQSVEELRQRADEGELIFIVLTVQDLRYGEDTIGTVDADTKELRAKYHALSGNVNLWIRDERHAQYGGEVTSQRLANMTAEYELDLTATPYNVLEKYNWEQIVSRTLLWGLKYKQHTKLPTIRIDAVSTPLANVSTKIAAMYSEEEGFDPRKLFVRSNGNFVFESELKDIRDLMYHSPLSKKKNPLSIANDTELSVVAKNCGFWVLPEGQDGDGAADYIPDLSALLNTNSKTYFTDSYTLEKDCPKNITIGDHIESLVKLHGRVIILTCGKFLTGTDIPILGHIVLMAKMNNIANFEQLLGRMIREYLGKDEVKMYCFAPAMEIGLVQGKMAKMNEALGGGSEYEMLECIPLTEYTTDGRRRINPNVILAEVQEFFKRISKDRLPSASLEIALSGIDLSVWEDLNTKRFKKSAPKTNVTEDNGSRVKNKLTDNPKTGKPYTKDELNNITQIANAIQTVMVEAKWVAYSIDNYDYSVVLNNPALIKMFPEEIGAVVSTIENDDAIKEMVVKNLNDKQLAYKGLAPIEVYDDIFMNNTYKQKIGLVYVPFSMAKELVDKLPANKYNKEGISICVFNALSGTIPLLLQEKFPKARIVCAEYFEYFKDHLNRLGFEVTDCVSGVDNKIKIGLNMKFDVIIGNPPYQSEKGTGTQPLWPLFVNKAFSLLSPTGHLVMITPNKWCGHTANVIKGGIRLYSDLFKGKLVECNIQECSKHFPKVGGYENCFSYFIIDNSGSNSFVATTLLDTYNVNKDQFNLYVSLIDEEVRELYDAITAHDKVETVDALIDILVVTIGAIHSMGADGEGAWKEVMRSNFSKVGEDGKVRKREDGKVLKPIGYSPPDLKPFLKK